MITNKFNTLIATIGMSFFVGGYDVVSPCLTKSETGDHKFRGWRSHKREATTLEMVDID